jgi:DHA3 family macrolide efflux protein-like MFS transporter
MTTATATVPAPPLTFREVLRIDVIRRIWYAQLVSLFGDFLALFAVIAVVSFRMHGTPSQLTGVQIAYMLPMVFVGPIAGVFVDRWPLKPTLIASDLVRAVLALLLIVSTEVWHVYFVLGGLSCVSAFFAPAQTVTIRTHVPPHGLVASNALMQMAFMGSRIVGPVTAGAIVAAFGPAICYVVDVVSFLASAALIGSVAIGRAVSAPGMESSSNRIHAIWVDMRKGMDFIFHHAALLFVVLAMAAGLFTIGCFAPLISIYVRDTLHAGSGIFGIISGAVGFGMMFGTQVVRKLTMRMAHETLVLAGLAGIGVGVAFLGAVPLVPAALTATFTIGFAFGAIMVPAQTLMQRETPHDMLGRVASTQISVVFLAQILGLVLSGTLADLFGVRAVFFLCAGLSVALVVAGRLFLRSGRSGAGL